MKNYLIQVAAAIPGLRVGDVNALRAYPELTEEEVRGHARNFFRRFFSQQFKRSCLPDGPKVGSVTLSPRGDWRMPSDAAVSLWMEDLT